MMKLRKLMMKMTPSKDNNLDEEEQNQVLTIKQEYDALSQEYLPKKKKAWKALKNLIHKLPTKSWYSILDLGGGNGRNLTFFKESNPLKLVLDLSFPLLKHRPKNTMAIAASVTHLPLRTNSIDICISIAVLHHLQKPITRQRVISELTRALRTPSFIFLTVWKRDRYGMYGRTVKLLLKNQNPSLYLHPWKNQNGKVIHRRHYYLFTRNELLDLVKSPFKLVEFGSFGGPDNRSNYFIIMEKRES